VHVIGAYTVPTDWTGGVGGAMDWVGEVEDAARDEMAETLHAVVQPLADAGLAATAVAACGRAADVIVATAAEIHADLVVTGSRGRGPLRSMLLGSVAAEVATRAPCPVLVARGPGISRLLVATDGSDCSRRICEVLDTLGAFGGMAGDAVSVVVPDDPAFELMVSLYTLGDERLARQRLEIKARAGEAANEMASRLEQIGITSTGHVRTGDPAAQILAAAEEHGADFIVTGSRGLGGVERFLLGSVSRNVLTHAHCSVLIARKEAPHGRG
jgi:nucleotide-binding universal stress UspA family protein